MKNKNTDLTTHSTSEYLCSVRKRKRSNTPTSSSQDEDKVLYSKKFSSAKNFVKSDRQAVRQEYIFVKRRSSLVCSSVVRSLLFCLLSIFAFLIPHLFVKKFSQEFNLVKKNALTKATKLNS